MLRPVTPATGSLAARAETEAHTHAHGGAGVWQHVVIAFVVEDVCEAQLDVELEVFPAEAHLGGGFEHESEARLFVPLPIVASRLGGIGCTVAETGQDTGPALRLNARSRWRNLVISSQPPLA